MNFQYPARAIFIRKSKHIPPLDLILAREFLFFFAIFVSIGDWVEFGDARCYLAFQSKRKAVRSMKHTRELFKKPTPQIRQPAAEDGVAIWELVRACKPLDENSMYCNLLQCDHFKDTCVVAELDGEIVGWVSAYILPYDPETVFVWQVAVAEKARGLGLGTVMLSALLQRDACRDVTSLQTTITRDNAASWALFRKFSKSRDAILKSQPYFTQAQHFKDRHSTEFMVAIDLPQAAKLAA